MRRLAIIANNPIDLYLSSGYKVLDLQAAGTFDVPLRKRIPRAIASTSPPGAGPASAERSKLLIGR